jgi:hypothetical protein
MNRTYAVPSNGPINRGDFNEDGIPDVIFLISTGVEVGLSSTQGNLTFLTSAGNTQGGGSDFSVAKFTSSGHLDVAITRVDNELNPLNTVDILLGHGDGTFEVGQPVNLPNGAGANSITTSDFNGDGKTDLAVSSGNKIYIFPGNGDGTFGAPKTVTTTFTNNFSLFGVRVGDFDADGRPDLVTGDSSHIAVLFNTGNFNFQQKDVTNESALTTGFTAADVNQDGFTDLLVTLQGDCPPSNGPCQSGYTVYTSQGSSRTFKVTFRHAPSFDQFPAVSMIVADVDGDGINDILFLTAPLHAILRLAKGNPDGSFGTPRSFVLGDINGGAGLVELDLNRDGRPDFAATNPTSGEIYTSLNAFARSGDCVPKKTAPSITVCQPTEDVYSKSPVHVVAKATFSVNPIRPITAIQTYVDGKLTTTKKNATNLDTTLSIPLGSHQLTVKGWDSAGNNFRSVRHLNIFSGSSGQVCSVAIGALRICLPAQNATVGTSVRVLAASNSQFESTSIQVYLDHQLVVDDDTANFIDRDFTLTPGTHTLTVKGWDVSGQQLSQSETIHVTQ